MTTRRLLALTAVLLPLPAARAGGPVEVRQRDRAVVAARVVTLADVADLTGGPDLLRRQLGRLDIAEVPRDGGGMAVSRRQIAFRLRLAGIPAATYRLDGVEATQVAARFRAVTADEVVTAARRTLAGRLPWPADDVQVQLVHPVLAALPAVAADEEVAIKAEMHPGHRPPGRVQMDVRVFVQGEQRFALPVYFEVRPYHRVVVCRRRVERGEELTDAAVYVERQPFEPRHQHALTPEALRGKRARRPLMPGHLVLTTDVEAEPAAAAPVAVKAQEAVKIRVRAGGLLITAAGQALQDGRLGQMIRVQNVDSKKVVLGRVVEAGMVEIE